MCRWSVLLEVDSELGSLCPHQLTELIGVLWKRKKLVILMSLPMLLATLIAIIPNTYESSGRVVVNTRNDPASMPALSPWQREQGGRMDSPAPETNPRSRFSVNIKIQPASRCGSTSKNISKVRATRKATFRCKPAIWWWCTEIRERHSGLSAH